MLRKFANGHISKYQATYGRASEIRERAWNSPPAR